MTTTDLTEPSAASRRAIVVDDSRATRTMIRKLLQNLNFDVIEAGDGAEALETLQSAEPVQLALVDWNMPVMDGLEFVKALRRERANADMVVMMVSAESDHAKVARALMVGADEYLTKPLTAELLFGKLEMLDVIG